MAELQEVVRDYLRTVITDPNPDRIGDNWIFDDFPRSDLQQNSFPRISCIAVGEINVQPMGMMVTDNWDNTTIQIDVWLPKDVLYPDIGGNEQALNFLCRDVVVALRDWRDSLDVPRKINVVKIFKQLQPFDEERRLWRHTMRYRIDNIDSGEDAP